MPAAFDIYTDGSCSGNPGPGGWAAIIEHEGETTRISGGERSTTNNRMEITAAVRGLEAAPPGATAVVHSDSEYLVKTMTKGWKRNVNRDLWEQFDLAVAKRNVDFRWVRGHAGHPQNEEADRLAVQAMQAAANGGGTREAAEQGVSGPLSLQGERAGVRVPPGAASSDSLSPRERAGVRGEAALTHIDAEGSARMVDVGGKPDSARTAIAEGAVTMLPATLSLIVEGRAEKGDVFTVARIAGINAAKHTWELIPLAHQVPLSHVSVDFEAEPGADVARVRITAQARTTAKTGVEMEALTAVSAAALTVYDMCKAVDRGMTIEGVRLVEKTGGTHGDYRAGGA